MSVSSADLDFINSALASWRQGDVCLQPDTVFVHLADLNRPLSEVALKAAQEVLAAGDSPPEEPEVVGSEVIGLVVTSQTCDIVRDPKTRQFVEVAPLISATQAVYLDVAGGRRPAYAVVPTLADQLLVADLSRTMSIEKSVLARWERTPGWTSDAEIRAFSDALARRRNRFAFPDDFVLEYVHVFHARVMKKHSKISDEGRFLNSLREIRVRAAPSWNAPKINVEWWFIKEVDPEGLDTPAKGWKEWTDEWIALLHKHRKYRTSWHVVCKLEDMTARDYVESDRLDFDRLSF